MAGVSQPDFKETALSEDLLSTPFHIQTKWCVITVPVLSPEERLEFVLKMLSEYGLT
jgi:hypothetical protein